MLQTVPSRTLLPKVTKKATVPKIIKETFKLYPGFKKSTTTKEKKMSLEKRLEAAQSVTEDKIEVEFTKRVEGAFKVRAKKQFYSKSGLRIDCLLFKENSSIPYAFIEYKRPDVNLAIHAHADQVSSYVIEVVRQYPLIERLEIIVTNGWDFIYGTMRKDYSTMEIKIGAEPFHLYDRYFSVPRFFKLLCRKTGILCDESLSFLTYVLQKEQESQWPDVIALDNSPSPAVIGDLAGIGGVSIVYDCKIDDTSDYVLKAFAKRPLFNGELENNQIFATLDVSPKLAGYSKALLMLVYEKCKPVIATFHGQMNLGTLEKQHIKQLFEKIKKIHSTGYCHRDIRMENIVLRGETALLADIAGCVDLGEEMRYHGSRETASQRILKDFSEDPSRLVTFTAADDLESLFKVHLMLIIPGIREKLMVLSTYSEFYQYWKEILNAFEGLPTTEEQWHSYFTNMFDRYEL